MRDQQRALLLGICMLALFGCKKDKEGEPPTVSFLLPDAGYSVHVPDTIPVRVAVSDDHRVESLTVLVEDADGTPVTASINTSIGLASGTVELALPVVGERIESGTYTLVARASDGEQDGRAFQSIIVQATPLRVRSLFVVPPVGTAPPYPIMRIDSLGELTTWWTLSELSGASLDLDHVYTTGTTGQGLLKMDINSGSTVQLLANTGVGTGSFFHGLVSEPADGNTFVGSSDGLLRGFTPTGNGTFTASSPGGWYSERTTVVDDRVVSIAFDPITTQRKMIAYAASSGTLLGQFPVDNNVVALFRRDDDHALLFGDRNGDGVIQERNVDQGGVFEMRVFPGEPILAATSIGGNEFAVALASGIHRFSYNSNSLVPLSSITATTLAYDRVSGTLLAGIGDQLVTLDATTGAQLGIRTLPGAIGTILILTNR